MVLIVFCILKHYDRFGRILLIKNRTIRNDKLIKKKIGIAAVLLTVYAIFMVQQVTLKQVLCYKADGSVDLEAAYLDFQCECKDKNHGNRHF